jgi:hypothetical protein
MPFDYRIHPDHRLAIVRLRGTLTGAELAEAVSAVLLDPAWVPEFGSVWDSRGLTELVLDPADIARLGAVTERLRDRMGPSRTAALIRGEVDEMTAQLFQRTNTHHPDAETRLFLQPGPAADWLGIPVGLIGPAPRG